MRARSVRPPWPWTYDRDGWQCSSRGYDDLRVLTVGNIAGRTDNSRAPPPWRIENCARRVFPVRPGPKLIRPRCTPPVSRHPGGGVVHHCTTMLCVRSRNQARPAPFATLASLTRYFRTGKQFSPRRGRRSGRQAESYPEGDAPGNAKAAAPAVLAASHWVARAL